MIHRESIPEARLRELVAQVTGQQCDDLGSWSLQPLHYDASSPVSLGLYRLAGMVSERERRHEWSLILKAIRSPAGVEVAPGVILPAWLEDLPPTEFGYWLREVLIYRSGVLENLPGSVAAPHCYGVDEVAPKVFWIWLEDVADADGGQWTVSRYAETARHLGQFNGGYLVGYRPPPEPWLERGWLRSWLEPGRPGASWQGVSPEDLEHPLIANIFSASIRDRLARLWNDREIFLDALDQLPQCLCHRDAWPPNLLIRSRHDGRRETIALDWAFAGLGPVGEEIAPLIVWSDVSSNLHEVEAVVLRAYMDGLRDAGWEGDPELVRRGYGATAVLRYSFSSALVAIRAAQRSLPGVSDSRDSVDAGEQVVAKNVRVVHFLLDLADEMRGTIQ